MQTGATVDLVVAFLGRGVVLGHGIVPEHGDAEPSKDAMTDQGNLPMRTQTAFLGLECSGYDVVEVALRGPGQGKEASLERPNSGRWHSSGILSSDRETQVGP